MNIELKPLESENTFQFKKDMMDSFQKGAVDEFGEMNEQVLPESHINNSLSKKGAVGLEAVADGQIVGGAVVVIDEETQHNHLDFLYVKNGVQSKGVGQKIWQAIEKMFPNTKVWEACTPYFEKRNIHFYVNRCSFHIVEFYNKYHKDPDDPDINEMPDIEYFNGMFRFEKVMK